MARPRKFPVPATGVQFGHWVITHLAQTSPVKMGVKCRCGKLREVLLSNLIAGLSSSCGCTKINSNKIPKEPKARPKASKAYSEAVKEGKPIRDSSRPEYRVWASMVQRVKNPKNPMYREGTDIAESWLYFPNFFKDMGERPVGKQLCRRDYNVGFDVNNCYWGEHKDAIENRRKQRPRSKQNEQS